MSIGSNLLAKLTDSPKGFQDYLALGLEPAWFKGQEAELFNFYSEFVLQYGATPSRTVLKEHGFSIPADPEEPAQYYVDKLKERHVHLTLKQSLLEAQDLLNTQKPYEALSRLSDVTLQMQLQKQKNKIVDFAQEGKDIIEAEYKKKMLLGEDYGIRFGWPTLDDMTGGLTGGDVVSLVGKTGEGKTWQLLYTALNAWAKQGKVPLFVTMEMKPLPIIQRVAAMYSHKPITQLKKAELATANLQSLMSDLEACKTKPPFWVIDGALTATIEDILLLCKQLQPDAIWVDGAYLLKHKNGRLNRWERVTDNAERMKGDIAEALNLPAIVSYQFNKEGSKKKAGMQDLDDIAFSSDIARLSSMVLGLFQDISVETLTRRKVQIMKGRNGEVGSFSTNWIFDVGPGYMNFDEVEEQAVAELQFV